MKESVLPDNILRFEKCIPKIVKGLSFIRSRSSLTKKLNFSQELVLASLYKKESLKMREISDETGINITAVTGIMDGLIKNKCVVRKNDPNDRRNVLAKLTKSGKILSEELVKRRRESILKTINKFNQKEQKVIVNSFEKLVNTLYEQEK